MLAFIDSPVQLLVVVVVILIVFGPQKLPEMLGQLGRAVRELKRHTSDLSSSLRLDEPYDSRPYDSYSRYNAPSDPTVPASDLPAIGSSRDAPSGAPGSAPIGDFAAPALADLGEGAPGASSSPAASSRPRPADPSPGASSSAATAAQDGGPAGWQAGAPIGSVARDAAPAPDTSSPVNTAPPGV